MTDHEFSQRCEGASDYYIVSEEILRTLSFENAELSDEFRSAYRTYFDGHGSRWRAVFEAVRSGAYSASLDNTIAVAQTSYQRSVRMLGLPEVRWNYLNAATNLVEVRATKTGLATELIPWFSIVEQDVFDVVESDVQERCRVPDLFQGLSRDAAYEYFNSWKFIGLSTPMTPEDEVTAAELVAAGRYIGRDSIPPMSYLAWLDFKVLKARMSDYGIPAKRGFESYRSALSSGKYPDAEKWVLEQIELRTRGSTSFIVPEPSEFTRNALMDLRVRAQTLMSIVELVCDGKLPRSILLDT